MNLTRSVRLFNIAFMASITKQYPEIGEVLLVKTRTAKRITLSVRPGRRVRVTIPSFCTYRMGEIFIKRNYKWIIKKLDEISSAKVVYDTDTDKLTRRFSLRFIKYNKSDVKVSLDNGLIKIYYPAHLDKAGVKVQTAVKQGVIAALRIEAREYLPERLNSLAEIHGFKYGRLTLRDSRTRWGSCSAANNINLSIHLMKLPYHLIDYVILHELVHTVHKNHGRQFWDLLQIVSGNARGLANEIRKYPVYYQ